MKMKIKIKMDSINNCDKTKLCEVLEKINSLILTTPENNLLRYVARNDKESMWETTYLVKLSTWGIVKIYDKEIDVNGENIFYLQINYEKFDRLRNEFLNKGKIAETADPIVTPIRKVKLDKENCLLEINAGEKFISFKSRKKGTGLKKETKLFNILVHLWEFRWEMKDRKVLKRGEFAALVNLKAASNCPTESAAYQHIKRLNNRFRDEGVSIKIEGKNGKYRLVIDKS